MRKKVTLCLLLVGILVLSACNHRTVQESEPETEKEERILKIGVPKGYDIPEGEEGVTITQALLNQKTVEINGYLAQQGEDYQVDLKMYTEQSYVQPAKKFDIILTNDYWNDNSLTVSDRAYYFVDMAPELCVGGKLHTLYESMPETYWKTVKQNHAIYTPVRTKENTVPCWGFPVDELSKIGMSVPEELLGEPLAEWNNFFEELYQKNDQVGFFNLRFYGLEDYQFLVDASSIPFLVAVEGENGPEVACLYELVAMEDMIFLLQYYEDAGYMYGYVDRENKRDVIFSEQLDFLENRTFMEHATGGPASVFVFSSASLQPIEDDNFSPGDKYVLYPAEKAMYNAVRDLGDEVFISTSSNNIDLVYHFYNSLAADLDFAKVVCIDEDAVMGEYILLNLSPYAELLLENEGDFSSNYDAKEASLAELVDYPAANFVFDESPVRAEMYKLTHDEEIGDAEMELLGNPSIQGRDALLEKMYEAGLQTVLDEANRQLKEYLGK